MSISEESNEDSDSPSVSFYVSSKGRVLTDPCEKVTKSPQIGRMGKKLRTSKDLSTSQRDCGLGTGYRKVRLWGNQKGVDIESDKTKVIVADMINRVTQERDRLLSLTAQPFPDDSPPPLPLLPSLSSPNESPITPHPRKSTLKRIDEVDFSDVELVMNPHVSRTSRKHTFSSAIQFQEVPKLTKKRVLYEPPPDCYYLKKFLNGTNSVRNTELSRIQSETRLRPIKPEISELPQRKDIRFPVVRSLHSRKGSCIQQQGPKLSHVKTRSLMTVRKSLMDCV